MGRIGTRQGGTVDTAEKIRQGHRNDQTGKDRQDRAGTGRGMQTQREERTGMDKQGQTGKCKDKYRQEKVSFLNSREDRQKRNGPRQPLPLLSGQNTHEFSYVVCLSTKLKKIDG